MKQESYEYFAEKINRVSWGLPAIKIAGKCFTYVTAFLYFVILGRLFLEKQYERLAIVFLVPLITFVAVSLFRSCFHQKRPYEVYEITPLIPKHTKEKSFPSRHVFSIFVIGVTLCFCSLPAGICICGMGGGLAVIRVVTGVHFPRDVIAGAVIGCVSGGLAGVLLRLFSC